MKVPIGFDPTDIRRIFEFTQEIFFLAYVFDGGYPFFARNSCFVSEATKRVSKGGLTHINSMILNT